MADQPKAAGQPGPQPPQPPQQQPPKPAAGPLGSAGASSNPLVHQLLAERAIMASVDDKDAVDALDDRLAGLGVSVEA